MQDARRADDVRASSTIGAPGVVGLIPAAVRLLCDDDEPRKGPAYILGMEITPPLDRLSDEALVAHVTRLAQGERAATAARIAAKCGDSLGRWAMMVRSALPTR